MSRASSGLGIKNGRGPYGDQYAATQGGAMAWGSTCGKCGARRIDSQLGLEPTPEAYVARMVEVFREVKRVLRKDGTVWCNLGDSYAANFGMGGKGNVGAAGSMDKRAASGLAPKQLVGMPWRLAFALQADGWYLRSDIIWSKPNPMPESVTDRPTKAHEYLFLLTRSARYFYDADAVREPGQPRPFDPALKTIRPNDTDWHDNRYAPGASGYGVNEAGRNLRTVWNIEEEEGTEWIGQIGFCRRCGGVRIAGSGPASSTATDTADTGEPTLGTDVPTDSSTKSSSGLSPMASPSTTSVATEPASILPTWSPSPSERTSSGETPPPPVTPPRPDASTVIPSRPRTLISALADESARCVCETGCDSAALGSVWRIPTEPFPEAHFATFPKALVEPCIKAGTSERGCCPECGAPWERVVELPNGREAPQRQTAKMDRPNGDRTSAGQAWQAWRDANPTKQLGWRPTCAHDSEPVPCTVLDPFAGSGTTGVVAAHLGREFIGIELSPEYAAMARRRIENWRREYVPPAPKLTTGQVGLFDLTAPAVQDGA